MNPRWYISTFIIILAFLVGISHEQLDASPNQEIVLQFTGVEVSSQDTQNTIAIVKQQLQDVGVENIQVVEQGDGRLKITYFSASNVESIKKMLSQHKALALGFASFNAEGKPSEFPIKDQKVTYNVDVFEIQKGHDALGVNGKMALEQKAESDRFSNPNNFVTTKDASVKNIEALVNVTYKCQKSIGNITDNRSHKIPEVRAGPNS